MIVNDLVYGKQQIEEKVIEELINSQPLQRLKKISQHGPTSYVLPWAQITRYEHCVGVMLLLKKYKASLKEQIAGLLHDVPHTAFSHTIDFVFKSKDQDYHDKFLEKVIVNSEIPEILKKFGFDLKEIINIKNFKLLEKEIPDLCADRIDYFLRHCTIDPRIKVNINNYLNHLKVENNNFFFDNPQTAFDFAQTYLKINQMRWASPLEIGIFALLAQALKIALDTRVINEADLFLTDQELFEKLKNSNNLEIKKRLNILNPSFQVLEDKENYDTVGFGKIRYIDPLVKINSKLLRVSEIFSDFKVQLNTENKRVKEGHYLKFIY